jgi:hypothetical protein
MNAAPELQGIGIQTKAIKQATLTDGQSSATTIEEFPTLAGKGLSIRYKIQRGTLLRTGEMVIAATTSAVSYDDNSVDSGSNVGVTLAAALDDKDSTAGNETLVFQYVTTSTGTDATIDYQVTILV